MSNSIKSKILVIIGAARGIGVEIAKNFLENNVKIVIILDIIENDAVSKLNEKFGENKAVFIKCDITKDLDEVFKNIIAKYKYVDIVINNAGVYIENNIRLTVAVNVTALMEFTLKFWNNMRLDKGGRGGTIMNISSIYGYRKYAFAPIYQGTKSAVRGFSMSLGDDYNYKRSGVRVLTICPGITYTAFTVDATIEDKAILDDFKKYIEELEWQQPEDIGRGAIKVFQNALSGSAWLIEGGRDPEKINII